MGNAYCMWEDKHSSCFSECSSRMSSWITSDPLLQSQMFFLCDSTELRALETLIQSQHHYNLLVHRWLIRNLVCIILLFSERRVLSVILITKIPFFFSPLFSSFLPDSVLLLSGGCSKIFKAGSYSPIFKREEMAIIFALFQDKKINK